MITIGGYSINYDRSGNRITILLPQTAVTMTNTMAMLSNRKTDFTDAELGTILYAVKAIAEGAKNDTEMRSVYARPTEGGKVNDDK